MIDYQDKQFPLDFDFTKTLQFLTVPCQTDEERFTIKKRKDNIQSIFFMSKNHLLYDGKLCCIYGKQNSTIYKEVVLISSRIDCLYDELFCSDKLEDCYNGMIDSSVINASVVQNMKKGLLADNTLIAFTGLGGEEEVLQILKKWNKKVKCVLALGVTNDGWEDQKIFTISVTLNFVSDVVHTIETTLDNYEGTFLRVGHDDANGASVYDDAGIPTYSLCLTSKGESWSENGIIVRKSSVPIYCDLLANLSNNFMEAKSNCQYFIRYEKKQLSNVILTGISKEKEEYWNDSYIIVDVYNGILSLPENIGFCEVSGIKDTWFMNLCKGEIEIKRLIVPKTFESLGARNFSRWKNLEEVWLYCDRDAMCEWNFAYCDNLKRVHCMNKGIYDFCKSLPLPMSSKQYGCFDGVLQNIEFINERVDNDF